MMFYHKHFLLALAAGGTGAISAADGDASSYNKKLRGVITLASSGAATAAEERPPPIGTAGNPPVAHDDSQSATQRERGEGGFKNSCLHGRFAYSNLVDGVASISVGLFDGMGKVTQMDNIEINHPNPDGGRMETSLSFNWGTYEVYPNGRGVMRFSFGAEGGPYFDPPALAEFVVTNAYGNCEIMNIDSFLSASKTDGSGNDVGVAAQLVAPRWSKIADF